MLLRGIEPGIFRFVAANFDSRLHSYITSICKKVAYVHFPPLAYVYYFNNFFLSIPAIYVQDINRFYICFYIYWNILARFQQYICKIYYWNDAERFWNLILQLSIAKKHDVYKIVLNIIRNINENTDVYTLYIIFARFQQDFYEKFTIFHFFFSINCSAILFKSFFLKYYSEICLQYCGNVSTILLQDFFKILHWDFHWNV